MPCAYERDFMWVMPYRPCCSTSEATCEHWTYGNPDLDGHECTVNIHSGQKERRRGQKELLELNLELMTNPDNNLLLIELIG